MPLNQREKERKVGDGGKNIREHREKNKLEEGHIQGTKEDHRKKAEKSGQINKTDTTIPLSLTKCIGQKK